MDSLPKIAIVEFGSQYTPLIESTIRELGFRSVILEPRRVIEWAEKNTIQAIILSGGAASVYQEDAPQLSLEVLNLTFDGKRVPVLGICYGMQWIAHKLKGKVEIVSTNREYGHAEISAAISSLLFFGTPLRQNVWANHGDSVTKVPPGFLVTATSSGGGIAAMENTVGSIFGVQFHPEVTHTPEGKNILSNFLIRIAGCEQDWQPGSLVSDIQESLRTGMGPDERAIFGFSGGVDSTFLAAVAAPVLGDRLLAVTIDGGHLRENELEEVTRHAQAAGVQHIIVDAREEFERVMADTIDAEEKRRRFKGVYVSLFRKAAQDFGASVIFQGTLAPDRIESGATGGAVIKSHHNVGLDFGGLRQEHPIDHLFKYEVRALAQALGLPKSVWNRQPSPGPGNFLRVNGIPASQHNLAIVQWAEARTREILEQYGIFETLSQLVVHLLGVKMVGVKGDKRVYAYPAVVRAIRTLDFMTATGIHLDEEVENDITTVLTRHDEIVCVMFNPTDKPPGTTEPE